MEAKVDIRKLQLLNDRINQTIDALNQVRLSVHGLSHTAGVPGPMAGVGIPFAGGFGQGVPFAGLPWGGMSHTAGVPGLGGMGQQLGYGGVQNAFVPPYLPQAFGVNPFLQGLQGGISHTSPETMGGDPSRQIYAQWLLQQQMQSQIDPYYGMRVSQTFPFAQLG